MTLPYLAIVLLILVTVYSAAATFRSPEKQRSSWIFPSGANKWVRRLIVLFTLAIALGAVLWFPAASRSATPRPLKIIVPQDYSGWVRIDFGVKDAPALPIESGEMLARIPADGRIKTSSPQQFGLSRDSYLFQSAAGLRPIPYSGANRMIWGKIDGESSGASGKQTYEEFFVGNEQQYRDAVRGTKSSSTP